MKLFFLLSDETMLSEDDENFQEFFQNWYTSISNLQNDLEDTFNRTMWWLLNKIFQRTTQREEMAMEIRQDEFEDEYG